MELGGNISYPLFYGDHIKKNLLVMWLEALHFPRSLLTSTTHIDLNSDLRQSCNRYESFDIRAILCTCYVICDDEN